MVTFNSIPADLEVPHVFIEFDSSRALQGTALQPYKVLVIGQRTSAGTVAELTPTLATSANNVAALFGAGSQLHGMAEALFKNNQFTEAWFVAQDDAGGSVAATKTITVTGPATGSGTIYLYVAGRRLTVGVAATDDANTVAAAIKAKLDEKAVLLPFTATVTTNVVTLTAKNAGAESELLDVRFNYGQSEQFPLGVSAVAAAGTTGSTNPDIDDVWAVLGEVQYNVLAVAYTDAGTLGKVDVELADRWGPLRMIEGHAVFGAKDTHSDLITLGGTLNSKHLTIFGQNESPTPCYEWAAAAAGQMALSAQADPGRPFQTLELKAVLPPASGDRFTLTEQNLLLQNGISTFGVTASGGATIQRAITTYQTNVLGADDPAFMDANTLFTLGYLRWNFRNRMLLKFPRHKLADDGVRLATGQPVVTPAVMRGEAIAWFLEMEQIGLVEGAQQFGRDIIVERNASNPNRLDIVLPPDLINGLRVLAVQIGFLL